MAIRGTTVVIPAALAWEAARDVAARGGARQGFLGVSSLAVTLPARQRAEGREGGLLVTGLADRTPAEQAGLLVGDVIVAFDGVAVHEPDDLLTLLRGDRVGSGGAARGGARRRTGHRDRHGDGAEARISCDTVQTPLRVFVSAASVDDRRRLHDEVRRAGWRLVDRLDDADVVIGTAADWPAPPAAPATATPMTIRRWSR